MHASNYTHCWPHASDYTGCILDIREKLGVKCPSIFALTAEALEGDKQRFLDLGFDGYLSKPLQTHTLQDALKTIKPGSHLANA